MKIAVVDRPPGWREGLFEERRYWDGGGMGVKIVLGRSVYGAWARRRNPKWLIVVCLLPFIRRVYEYTEHLPAF